jgi:hypothetical protein
MSNLKMSVSGVKILNDEDLLNYDRQKEAELAPPVDPALAAPFYLQAPAGAPAEPEMEAPMSLAPPPAQPAIAPPSQSAPRKDYSAELAAAQEQGRNTKLIAAVGRAGESLIQGGTGVKPSGAFEDMAQGAGQPVKDLEQRMALDEAERKIAGLDDAKNPASRGNRMAQAAARRIAPAYAASLPLDTMTAPEIEAAFSGNLKHRTEDRNQASMEGDIRAKQATDANADALRTQNAGEFDRELPIKQQQADAAMLNARKMPFAYSAAAAEARGGVASRRAGADLLDYQKQNKATRDVVSKLMEVERLAPGFTKGVLPPGMSPDVDWTKVKAAVLPKGIGSQFTEPQAAAFRSAVMMFKAQIRHLLAGSALTDYEANYYENAFQDAVGSAPEVQAAVIDMFRRSIHNNLASSAVGYEQAIEAQVPGMWKKYEADPRSITPRHAIWGDLNGPPPAAAGGPGVAAEDKDAKALQWAEAHPNDPLALKILQKINAKKGRR